MKVYTYTEARRNLASLLDRVAREGEARIKRRDGQVFVIKPQPRSTSPLDVAGIDLDISSEEIVTFIADGRRSFD
jgi:antitoxin (DNA-binding transcriptional repressor) of toxin-antitoxin stability system